MVIHAMQYQRKIAAIVRRPGLENYDKPLGDPDKPFGCEVTYY